MRKKTVFILWLVLIFAVDAFTTPPPGNVIKSDIVTISVEQQYNFVNPYSKSALAIHFQLKENWYFYASAKTAPGGMNLKIKPSAERYIGFSGQIFPQPQLYFDKSSGKKLHVFSNNFIVYLPFRVADIKAASTEDRVESVKINIEGAMCSGFQCRLPDVGDLSTAIRISFNASMDEPKFILPDLTEAASETEVDSRLRGNDIPTWTDYSIWFALGLAFLAGLSLNIMPCIWPVLPIIVMRIVEQAKQSKGGTITMGFAFCFGILLFFACLAGANIVLQVFYGTVLQWGDQFRNPAFVAAMALLLVVLALFMFDVFTITVPAAVSGKSGTGKGHLGTVGMGFLAAVLSTPCSFAILAAAFAWAQTQKLPLATAAIMIIGVGMALPYLILTSIPGLLERLPKPGQWMDLLKKAVGFILLGIAVWLITVVPQDKRVSVLYFAVVLSFCVWMWGGWVSYNSKLLHKIIIRILAVVLVVTAGWWFLSPHVKMVDWQEYDADLIDTALKKQRPVLINFTADWCLSCTVLEKTVYSKKDIAELIEEKDVLVVKADTTVKDYPATLALKNVYNEPGVPVSMLFLPGVKEPVSWRGKSFADELKELLEKLPSK
jgi:thiol:disulfide interchange protein